ncbi:MAG: large conductance mechanosensitive channel protein MscL [Clostridiales Family XIII bacterium]|jgi:large conductance mechanosensitive channel|nr:large conductance mechanosensitive channel protein MscL [Clostridiales Family XIII bacterium]
MRKFLKEFSDFAFKGNVMNLAIGVIIGAAFQGMVASLTTNILSPVIGLFAGANFESLHIVVLGVEIKYGAFATSLINFLIMAMVVFLLVKLLTSAAKHLSHEEKKAEEPRKCPYCMMEIAKGATRCPHCTSMLDGSAAPAHCAT